MSPPPQFGRRRPMIAASFWSWFQPRLPRTSGNTSSIETRMKENSTIKEKSLQPVEAAVHSAPTKPAATTEEIDERILQAAHAASDKKALDLVLIDLREIATFTDYFLIT